VDSIQHNPLVMSESLSQALRETLRRTLKDAHTNDTKNV